MRSHELCRLIVGLLGWTPRFALITHGGRVCCDVKDDGTVGRRECLHVLCPCVPERRRPVRSRWCRDLCRRGIGKVLSVARGMGVDIDDHSEPPYVHACAITKRVIDDTEETSNELCRSLRPGTRTDFAVGECPGAVRGPYPQQSALGSDLTALAQDR